MPNVVDRNRILFTLLLGLSGQILSPFIASKTREKYTAVYSKDHDVDFIGDKFRGNGDFLWAEWFVII